MVSESKGPTLALLSATFSSMSLISHCGPLIFLNNINFKSANSPSNEAPSLTDFEVECRRKNVSTSLICLMSLKPYLARNFHHNSLSITYFNEAVKGKKSSISFLLKNVHG